MKRLMRKEMLKAEKSIKEYIKKNKKLPKEIIMITSEGKKIKLNKRQYCGLFDNQANFFNSKGRLPNYTSLIYETNTPFVGSKQPNSYTCGSTSLHNSATQILIYVTEKQCRKACKTTSNGTTPANLIAGAKKLGIKVTQMERTLTNIKKSIDSGHGVIAHIETAGKTKPQCLSFIQNFGHWISIYNYSNNILKVYDPTKGYKNCNASQIINATNGRKIYFYDVAPL